MDFEVMDDVALDSSLKVSKNWKTVQIDQNFILAAGGGGLISFEELRQDDGPIAKTAASPPVAVAAAGETATTPAAAKRFVKKISPCPLTDQQVEEITSPGWSFLNLHPSLLQGLAVLGFKQPTPIQREALPSSLFGGVDVIGAAETGSGKTLAFALPILNQLLYLQAADAAVASQKLQALILVPTRELALQVHQHIEAVARFTPLRSIPVVGGMSALKQRRLLATCPEIAVVTPGRCWDLLSGPPSHLSAMEEVRFLVLDEADRMVSTGHFPELEKVLVYLRQVQSQVRLARQTFLFSATLTLPTALKKRNPRHGSAAASSSVDQVLFKMTDLVPFQLKPKIVDLTSTKRLASTLDHARIDVVDVKEKDFWLCHFLSSETLSSDPNKAAAGETAHKKRAIVFVNAVDSVRRLVSFLREMGVSAVALHANMQQRQRLQSLERLREDLGKTQVLVATDVAARGLDLPSIDHVIHYHIPKTADVYIHRSGRSGRAGSPGFALSLVCPQEMTDYKKICRAVNEQHGIPRWSPAAGAEAPTRLLHQRERQLQERVRLAQEIERLEYSAAKRTKERTWERTQLQALELEDSSDGDKDNGQHRRHRRTRGKDRAAEEEERAEQAMQTKRLKQHIAMLRQQLRAASL